MIFEPQIAINPILGTYLSNLQFFKKIHIKSYLEFFVVFSLHVLALMKFIWKALLANTFFYNVLFLLYEKSD